MSDIFYKDHNYKFTIIDYEFDGNLIHSEELLTFNSKTVNLNIPAGYTLAESPIINLGERNTVHVQRSILTNTLLFIDNVSGEVIHRQNFTGYTGDTIDRSSINMPYGYNITSSDPIIIDGARNKRIMVDNNIIPVIKIDPQRVLHKVTIKYMFNEKLISTELVSVRGWRKPIITIPTGYKAKDSRYFDGWNPNKPEFIVEVLPKEQRINIEVRDKRNNVVVRNISLNVPYDSEFNPAWVTDIVKGFRIDNDGYDHEIIRSSGNFTVYGELEQYWSVNVPFKENLTGDLKDDINFPEITFQKNDMINNAKAKAKKTSIWKHPNQLSGITESLFSLHNSSSILEINNLIKELRSDNASSLQTVTDIVSDKEMRVKINKIMKNDMFFNRLIDLNTYNKIDLFQLDEYSYNSIEDYHVSDALENINAYNERFLEYTMKFPFGYMISNIKEDNIYHSIMRDLVFYNEADDRTSVIKFDINTYNTLISKLNEYIDLTIDLKTNVAAGYTSPHLNLHEDLIALANGRIIRDLQNVPSDVNLTTIPEYIGMNAYGRLNANIAKLRLAILNEDVYGLIINRFKFRKSDIPNDHGLSPDHTWIYDDYGYLTWENATKLIELIQDIYNLSGNLTITEGNKGNNELISIKELDVSAYNRTLLQKMYDLFYHNMDNMVETILAEEIRNHILENNAVNSLKYSWARLKVNLPKMVAKFINNDIEVMTAAIFKKFVYPFFSLFEIMYTVADNNHTYSNIYKDYSYYRNEAKKTNWLSKEDDILVRNVMKDMSKLITIFRKYYKGGGLNEFYKDVIEKVCHTPLSTKDIQAFNGIAGIDNIAKLNRSLDYRPAIYLDDIYPDNAPIKRLSWFSSKEITTNERFTYSYFINDSRFDNIYITPYHTWKDLTVDIDTELDDRNVDWYVDPKDEIEVKKTRYLTLEERIYKLITHVLKNNTVLLDRYINLINNFYSSVEDPIKYGWHKVHLKNINLDDRLIRTMGTFIDVHTKFQNVKSEINKITDTTKPYIFSNTMSITDNASEYVNARIQWKNDTNVPTIKCSLFAIYDHNLHVAKVECNSDGVPIRVFTTVYGNRECKPVFIAPANSDSTLIIKSGIDFTLNCDTAEVIASKINNADINKYDKKILLDSKYNGDIIINHTGETPTDKTMIWGSNENKTIYSKFETIGEIDEISVTPEFSDLLVEYDYHERELKPDYRLDTIIEKRNIIAKRRYWNENYQERFLLSVEGYHIRKKQLININAENYGNIIFNDTLSYEDIKVSPIAVPVVVKPHELNDKTFNFTATFVNKNGQPIVETEAITKTKVVEKTVDGRINYKWTKRHPESIRYIPRNGVFWTLGAQYYIEIIDSENRVYTRSGTVSIDDINNGYIEYKVESMPEGNVISTFVIQELGKFRSVASIDQYEQYEVSPDDYFVVNNITLDVVDQLMNRRVLNEIADYERSILNKNVIKGQNLPLVLPPNIKIDVDTLAPYVRVKINPTDDEHLVWEYSFAQDRLNYKYNYQRSIVLINENNAKSNYDFIKTIGSYNNYDAKISTFYNLYPNTFVAKPGKSYRIIVETCDFDGTELNTYEYTKTFTDIHVPNTDSSKFLKNSTDNTYLPNSITFPDGNERFIWMYNNIDRPLITDTKIFGVSKENGTLVELPDYDSLSNINGEYINNTTMEGIDYGEYIKWTVDTTVGYPALEESETYFRNERISPSLITANLDVSLSSKDGTEDDDADYFINASFTHKYIRDNNTKIAVQLFTVKDGVEKKLATKVVTYGEYVRNGFVSFPREDISEDETITYKTKIALINDIQIGNDSDVIDYYESPRNKTEYEEDFVRTTLPFFDKKPDDIMVLNENKIHIRKDNGVSYTVGTMGLVEIFDRNHNQLVTKEFTVNAADVNKGEVTFELDPTLPQIFTFHIYMQEPGKLPALPYVTSAYLATWKIEDAKPTITTRYINVMSGFTNDNLHMSITRFKVTIKKYPNKPITSGEIDWRLLVNKTRGYMINVNENITLEVVEPTEYLNKPDNLYKEYEGSNDVIDSNIAGLSYYPDPTNKYARVDDSWGYADMVANQDDTFYNMDNKIDVVNMVNNTVEDSGNAVTLYAITENHIGYGRYDKKDMTLTYGYRIVNGVSVPVTNTITFRWNRYDTRSIGSDKLYTYTEKLFDLTNKDKKLNDFVEIEKMTLNTDILKEITGVNKNSTKFSESMSKYFTTKEGAHLYTSNEHIDGYGNILYNMVIPKTQNDERGSAHINLKKAPSELDLIPVLGKAAGYNKAQIDSSRNNFVWVTTHLEFGISLHARTAESSNTDPVFYHNTGLTIIYKRYHDNRKIYANIKDLINKRELSTETGEYVINSDVKIKCKKLFKIDRDTFDRHIQSGYPEAGPIDGRLTDYVQWNYALLKEEDVYINRQTLTSAIKWKTGEEMPEVLNGKSIRYRFIPIGPDWESKALVLDANTDITQFVSAPAINKYCMVAGYMRGTYYDKLYGEFKNQQAMVNLTLNCRILPFNLKYKYNNIVDSKVFTPTKVITLNYTVPKHTIIDAQWLKHYTKFDNEILSSNINQAVTADGTINVDFTYNSEYTNNNTPLIFPDIVSKTDAENSINITEYDFISKTDVVEPFVFKSKYVFSKSDINVTFNRTVIPKYTPASKDNQYNEFNESYKETMTVNVDMSEVRDVFNKDTQYTLTIDSDDPIVSTPGDSYPYAKHNKEYMIGNKDINKHLNINYKIGDYNITKTLSVKRSPSIMWDVSYTKNNKFKVKLDIDNTISEIDVVVNPIRMNNDEYHEFKTIKVTPEDRDRGYVILDMYQLWYIQEEYSKLNVTYRSISESTNDVIYLPSNVKCETRTINQTEGEGNPENSDKIYDLSIKFRVKNITNALRYGRLSGLVDNTGDYRTPDDWSRFAATNPITINNVNYTGLDTELKEFRLNVINMNRLTTSNFILPEGIEFAKSGWLNNETESKNLISGVKNEIIVDININPSNEKYEYNENIDLDMTNFGLKYDNNEIAKEGSPYNAIITTSTAINPDDAPIELRFFLYRKDNKFYALYVWVPYKELESIKDYTLLNLVNNVEKYEFRIVEQLFTTDNNLKPFSRGKFNNILPTNTRLEEYGINMSNFNIQTIRDIITNTSVKDSNNFILTVPDIQRYITSDNNIIIPLYKKDTLTFRDSLQLDKLKTAITNYNRFIYEGEVANKENSKYKPVSIKYHEKYIVEYITSPGFSIRNDVDYISFDITMSSLNSTTTNNVNIYNRALRKSPWYYIPALGSFDSHNDILPINIIKTVTNIDKNTEFNKIKYADILNDIFTSSDYFDKVVRNISQFDDRIQTIKSRINARVFKESIEAVYSQAILNSSGNPYEPNLTITSTNVDYSKLEDLGPATLANRSSLYGYYTNETEIIDGDTSKTYRVLHYNIHLLINTDKVYNNARAGLRSSGNIDYYVEYLPNPTGVYNTIADNSGIVYNNLNNVKHRYLYEIPDTIGNDYLGEYTNHYIFHLKDIVIDWEFISGEHQVMVQDLLNIHNIYNPTELGVNTQCSINVSGPDLNDKLKEIFVEYKGNTLSDFNMLDYIDNITYKDTDKVVPKITIINTNKLEAGEFTIRPKTNKYTPAPLSEFNRSNFFIKLDIFTDFKYKYDINDEDKEVLNDFVNDISIMLVVNKKNNSVYEFENINDYKFDMSKSKLFILKSKRLDKMEMIAKEFDKKWLLSKINDNLDTRIEQLLKKTTISPSLRRILSTIKSSSIPAYEWFINGYNVNSISNDNIILSTSEEIKGSTLINAIISKIDYNYTIKNNMYISVVEPLNLTIDLDVVPSNSWNLNFIYNNKEFYSTRLLEEPSEDVIKNIWYSLNDNENMTIFKDNTIDMYTNTIKKTISVFAKDIIDTHTLTLVFKSNVFSKEQRTFNITKYSHSTISENEFWDIFQSSNIHEHFTTNVPNIIKHYDFTYDTTVIVNMSTKVNKTLEDIPDVYYGANVNIKVGNKTISKIYYKPYNTELSYQEIYNDMIVPINKEHYLNDDIKRVYYLFKTFETKIIDKMLDINIETVETTDLINSNTLFNSNTLPVRKTPITYDIPIKRTDNVTRLLNSINEFDPNRNTFITNIGDTSIDIESRYARFFNLPTNALDIYYSEPLKQVIRRLSLLEDSRLEQLSPRLNEVRRRAIIGNMPVTPSSVNIVDTTDTTIKAIDVYNINITATHVNIYLNLPAFYDLCYAVNYEPGDMLTVARVTSGFNIQNKVKLSFKRSSDINNSKILIAHFCEDLPVVNPLIIDVANSSYTLAGNTISITNTNDITDIAKTLKIRGLIKMNDKTLPEIKRVKNSGLWLKQTSAIYDEYTDSEVEFIEDFYPLYHTSVNPSETIALVDNNTNIAYARTSSASCIIFRDGTEFYPIYNDISALKILSTSGVLKLY